MRRLYQIVTHLSWGLLVFFLPITSFPLLAKAAGGTDVAPISVVFLFILVVIWFLPGILKGRGVPQQSIPLLIFFLIALIASFLAFFYPIPNFKNEPIWKNELPNIITLGIGICFYLVTSLWISDEGKLKTFFRILNISGGIALVYTLVQALFVLVLPQVPAAFYQLQSFISSSDTLFANRVNGMAFEPSWLAHQLNMFYIPIWLGLTIKRVSFHKLRFFKITLENILLVVSLVILFLSYSRIGWLAFLVYFGYLFLRLMDSFRQKLGSRMMKSESAPMSIGRFLFNAGFWFIFLMLMLAILIFVGWIFTKVDRRMQQFLDIQVILDTGLLGWASKLEFAERIVYWIAGFKVFLHYPVLGVGLGNSGFFIPQNLSSFGYGLPEVLRIFLSNTFLPNPKNLWVRILAETGIVGFSVFVSWLWVGWKTARGNERNASPLAQAMGITGQVVIVGLIVEGFSLDTFALPYYWMTLGLVVAVFRIFSLNSGRPVQSSAPAAMSSKIPT